MEKLENIMSVLQEAQIANLCSFWIRFKKKKSKPKLEFPRKKNVGYGCGGVCMYKANSPKSRTALSQY